MYENELSTSFEKKPNPSNAFEISEHLLKASESIQYLCNMIKRKSEIDENKEDWKFIASVLDRFMFIVFLFVTVIGFYFTLLNPQ